MSAKVEEINDSHLFAFDDLLSQVRGQARQRAFGWRTLDRLEIGFNPGDLTIVAGRTGHGKSTVLLNILLHWLESYPDERYLLFSYEIPPATVALKLVSTLTRKRGGVGWSYHDVRRWVQGEHNPTANHLNEQEVRDARDLSRRVGPIAGLIVDYLQLVQPPPGRYENREHEVTMVAKELKKLAVELGCPSMAAAQIGREAAEVTDWVPDGTLEDERVLRAIARRRPQLHHLREGGGEREADLVIGLLNYRADYVAAAEQAGLDKGIIETGNAGPFDVAVIKNRYGQLGLATLVIESRTGYVRDAGVFGR
jgi:replicative DNA helicase